MHGRRFASSLTFVPPAAAVCLLAALYLLRWPLFEASSRVALASVVESSIGGDVEVASIEGTVFTDLRIRGLTTRAPADRGIVRELAVDEIQLRYRTVEILTFAAALAFPRWPGHTKSYDVSWVHGPTDDLAQAAENLWKTLPESLAVLIRGRLRLRENLQLEPVEFEITRVPRADSPVVTLSLSGVSVPFGWDGDSVGLAVYAHPGTVGIRSIAGQTSPGFSVDAAVTAEDRVLTRAVADVAIGGLDAAATVDTGGGSIRVTATGMPGGLDGRASIEAPRGISVVEELFAAPSRLLANSVLSVNLAAANWRSRSFALDRLKLVGTWRRGALDVRNAALAVDAVATPPELPPDESALSVSMSGSLELAEGGTFLQRLAGDFGGSLHLNDPRRVWAVASDFGIVPNLPPGYSMDSAVVTFHIAGDSRLTVTAAAASPTIAGTDVDVVSLRAAVDSKGSGRRIPIILESLAATKGGSTIEATGNLTLDLDSADLIHSYRASLYSADLEALVPTVGAVEIAAAGSADGVVIERARLVLESIDSIELVLSDAFSVDWSEGSVRVSPFLFESEVGSVRGAAAFDATGSVDAELETDGLPLAYLVGFVDQTAAGQAEGTVDVRVEATGPATMPTIHLEAEGRGVRLSGKAATITVSARQENREIHVSRAEVALPGILDFRADGSLPVAFGSEGMVRGKSTGARFDVALEAPHLAQLLGDTTRRSLATFGAQDAGIDAVFSLRATEASAEIGIGPVAPSEEPTIAGTRPYTSFILSARTTIRERRLPYTVTLAAGADTLVEVSGTVRGRRTETAVGDLSVDGRGDAEIPLARISHLLPGVSLFGGTLTASAEIAGKLGRPELSGAVTIRDGVAKFAPTVPTVSDVTGTVRYAGGIVSTDSITGTSDGERFTVIAEMTGLGTGSPRGKVNAGGTNLLLARAPDLRVRGSVDVALVIEPGSSSFTGRIEATDVLYSRRVELFSFGTAAATPADDLQLFQLDSAWARNLSLDLRFIGSDTIRVRNNLYDGSLSADMRLSGSAAVPRPEGRVFGDSGTVRLPTAELDVRQVELLFSSDAAFQPTVFLEAETTIRGYDMVVTADGQIPDVDVQIVSSPPLATDEAIVLLTTGRRPGELDFTGDVSGTLTAVGTVLGRSLYEEIAASLPDDGRQLLERLDFRVQQAEEEGVIGDVEVEYQLSDGRRWFLLFNRTEEEDYSVQLAWRLWID